MPQSLLDFEYSTEGAGEPWTKNVALLAFLGIYLWLPREGWVRGAKSRGWEPKEATMTGLRWARLHHYPEVAWTSRWESYSKGSAYSYRAAPDCGRSCLQDEAQSSSWNGGGLPETGTQEEEQFGGKCRRALEFQGRLGTQVWQCHLGGGN